MVSNVSIDITIKENVGHISFRDKSVLDPHDLTLFQRVVLDHMDKNRGIDYCIDCGPVDCWYTTFPAMIADFMTRLRKYKKSIAVIAPTNTYIAGILYMARLEVLFPYYNSLAEYQASRK